jgi:hypothetical protein
MQDCHCDAEPYKPALSGRSSSSGAAVNGSGAAVNGSGAAVVSLLGRGSTLVVDGQTFMASKDAEDES